MEDCWWNVNTALDRLDRLSTGVDGGPLLQTNVDVFIHSIELCSVDDGSHCCLRVVRVAGHDGLGNLAHLFQ